MRKGKCMQEVKQPNKKPFIFYYMIALIVIILINSLLVPQIVQRAVKEVDYNTFMQMTYDKQIDEVQVQDNQIVFTAKDDKTIYKTGLMDDPDRTQRLYDSGAKFSSEIVEEASPILSFLISWLLPLIIIIGFGQLMYRQMAKKGRRRLHDVRHGRHGQEQCEGLCEVFQRYQVHRCGRRGRGERKSDRDRGIPA